MLAFEATSNQLIDPAWRSRVNWGLAFIFVLLPALYFSEANPATLLGAESLKATLLFIKTFWPPKLEWDFLLMVVQSSWKTVAIATVGVSLALLLALPLTFFGVRLLSVSGIGAQASQLANLIRWCLRALAIVLRSVPEIVWALIFVRTVGLGDTAGVLAIALSYAGMLAKVFIDIIESNEHSAAQALLAQGSSRFSAFMYGTLPTCALELASYLVYRWECAIRASVVMGFVGAGGLGQQMELSMRMLAGNEVVVMLFFFILLTAIADQLSSAVRKLLA